MAYIAQEQICLDEGRTKVVPCDSPEARSNLAIPGMEVSDEDCKKYGVGGAKAAKSVAADEEDEPTATDAPTPVQEKTVSGAPANKAVGVAPDTKKK